MLTGKVRIIGGKWRGRKLNIAPGANIRPTPDRVRETLFNWLTVELIDASCLDMFAGSGALGLEALSRGANDVVMIDKSPKVTKYLHQVCNDWGINRADVYCANALHHPSWLSQAPAQKFNVVFVDPPYHAGLIYQSLTFLTQHKLLANHAVIYVETNQPIIDTCLPPGWIKYKNKIAGQVYYYLYIYNQRTDVANQTCLL